MNQIFQKISDTKPFNIGLNNKIRYNSEQIIVVTFNSEYKIIVY